MEVKLPTRDIVIGRTPLGSLDWPVVLKGTVFEWGGTWKKKVVVLKDARARNLELRYKFTSGKNCLIKGSTHAGNEIRPAAKAGVQIHG